MFLLLRCLKMPNPGKTSGPPKNFVLYSVMTPVMRHYINFETPIVLITLVFEIF